MALKKRQEGHFWMITKGNREMMGLYLTASNFKKTQQLFDLLFTICSKTGKTNVRNKGESVTAITEIHAASAWVCNLCK